MKRIIPLICSIAMLVGCEMLTTDNAPDNNENVEDNQKVTLYHITDDIDVFESVFLAEDGNCLAIKKDTTFGFVAVIDSLKADDEKALVVYIDSLGKVRRVFNDGKSLDISYNSDENINLWYREADGTSEVFNEIKYTSTKAITKAGEVFDPTDFVSIGLALLDLKDLGDAVAFNPLIGEALKANIVADLLTTGPFSNTTTEILTGVTSVAITAAIGTSSVPIAVLLATIGVADAVISDWQNMVADSYFGTATPITGDAVQLTDNHFVISYSLNGVNPNQTDFNIGVIIADGLYITKKHHLLKKSISYDKSDTGYIIVNLKELDRKKGDKLKYRIYLEPANDNGFKWDDKLLDYWRYGKVKDLVIDEPALKVESANQTDASSYHGYKYTFKVDVNVINDIPLDLDEWGVAIYKTSLDECTNEDQQCDIKSAEGNGRQTISFSIDVNDVMMDTEKVPYKPIMNHFAVPYISLNGNKYGLFDNAFKIYLCYDDSGLRQQLIKLYNDTNGDNWKNNDNWCSDSPINQWYGVHLGDDNKCEIHLGNNNLNGVVDLSNCEQLASLNIINNYLESLNISNCPNIGALYVDNNPLVSISISNCDLLTNFDTPDSVRKLSITGCESITYCYKSWKPNLEELYLNNCTNLTKLECWNNQLKILDVSGCTNLTSIVCDHNQLEELILSGCDGLEYLYCHCNSLTSIELKDCSSLLTIFCSHNSLQSIDVSNTAVQSLDCGNNKFTELVISKNTITSLNCENNQLYNIDISGCDMLSEFKFTGNPLESLSAVGCKSLTLLSFHDFEKLTNLHLSDCGIKNLYIRNSPISNIDIMSLNLKNLDLYELMNLKYLNISEHPTLESLYCNDCAITTLIAENCPCLVQLDCDDNQLNSLGVQNNPKLKSISCENNNLTELDVTNCTCLLSDRFHYRDNPLVTFKVSGCTALKYLHLSNMGLQSIDVSNCTGLSEIDCSKNNLSSLDLSALPKLGVLDCSDNKLTKLDLSSTDNLWRLDCRYNLINSEKPEWFNRIEDKKYDRKYYYGDCDEHYLCKGYYTINTYGWWGKSEPYEGYHLK